MATVVVAAYSCEAASINMARMMVQTGHLGHLQGMGKEGAEIEA